MKIFSEKNIVLGITGSIAAYKAASIASQLVRSGANVQVAMSRAAASFVGPLTFESLTKRPVVLDVLALGANSEIEHVAIGKWADLVLIAPATANSIAKLAHGLADDALCAIALTTRAPMLIAPAMETGMWENSATRQNVSLLKERGVFFVEPATGRLASGAEGAGRLAELEMILAAARSALARGGPLRGRHIVVTAGGTQEPIDPVRVITNRSSGRMGFALAEEALSRGAEVSFISALEDGQAPHGARVVITATTEEMCAAVLEIMRGADALIMSAAPADYRVAGAAKSKIKKDMSERFSLELLRNPDILANVAEMRERDPGLAPGVVVGFAAETENLIQNARQKLENKHLDLIVANPVPQTFGSDQVQATLLAADGELVELEPMSKESLAAIILDRIQSLIT